MTQEKDKKEDPLKLGTTLNLDDLRARAEKPPKNLVPRKNKSLGYIIFKKNHGRIYYYWVRTEYRANLPPRQEIIMYIGRMLPPGVRLGKVDAPTANKLTKIASAKKRGSDRA